MHYNKYNLEELPQRIETRTITTTKIKYNKHHNKDKVEPAAQQT